jgi:hypothetical protein
MEEEFAWTHPCGMEVRRLPKTAVKALYEGHEVASHTLTHPYMSSLSPEETLRQMKEDKARLEELFGREVAGFAVPFRHYSDLIAEYAKQCGFEYARTSEFTHSYTPCRDYYYWKTGFYHIEPGLADYAAGFLNSNEELALCQLVGHSYDLDAENLWGILELICAAVAPLQEVWKCTNLELVRYLKAMDAYMETGENRSGLTLWFEEDGLVKTVAPI